MKKSLKTTALYHPLTDISARNIVRTCISRSFATLNSKNCKHHSTYNFRGFLIQSSFSLTMLPIYSQLGGNYVVMVQGLKLEKPEINQPLDLTAELFQEYAVTFQCL